MDLQALTLVTLANHHQEPPGSKDEESYYRQMGEESWIIRATVGILQGFARLFHGAGDLKELSQPYAPRRKVIAG